MSQDNLTHWLISTRGETCFSLKPMTAATDFLKREAMMGLSLDRTRRFGRDRRYDGLRRNSAQWDRADAALGVLRGVAGDDRLRPLVAPRR